uniref:Uncharacterized protein n=1 Tax=Photinus pyralis TaxID=7054 RepID=A0A1Y1JSQ3_PHOPY
MLPISSSIFSTLVHPLNQAKLFFASTSLLLEINQYGLSGTRKNKKNVTKGNAQLINAQIRHLKNVPIKNWRNDPSITDMDPEIDKTPLKWGCVTSETYVLKGPSTSPLKNPITINTMYKCQIFVEK